MNPDIFHYIVITSISGVLSLILALYAFSKRRILSSSTIFVWMSVFSAIYIFGHALELASGSLEESIIWLKVQYFGMPFVPPLSLLLALQFIGSEKGHQARFAIPLFIIPVFTTLFCLTNEVHHFMYRDIYLRPGEVQPLIDIVAGPWYVVHGSFTFGCLLLGAILLARYWLQTKAKYWKQVLTMIIGFFIPVIASFLYLLGLSPYGMDPVPIVMCFTSALYLWAILSTKLFVIAPIARDRIFESMRDGVLVIDMANQLVDYNRAARKIIPVLHFSKIGSLVNEIWADSGIGPFPFPEHPAEEEQEVEWIHPNNNSYYQIHLAPVRNQKGDVVGRTIVIINTTKQKALEKRLTQLAYTDGLTKIFNRAYLFEKCEEVVEIAAQRQQPLALIMFDIDFFKKINDNFGHAVGDEAIRHVVSICNRHMGPEYIFGRYGGEEFVVCLPDTTLDEAGIFAERIRKDIEDTPLSTSEDELIITASFGVSGLQGAVRSLDVLLQEADRALYVSKENGRNTVHLADQAVFV